jgi:hypothetical protein
VSQLGHPAPFIPCAIEGETGSFTGGEMTLTRQLWAAAGAVALLTLSGCGFAGDQAVAATATGSLEHLAAEANCRPDIQTDAAEIRQAICETDAGRFILATFATDAGQGAWLDQAKDYGGHYLVGIRWIAVGETNMVTALRGRLGGTLEEGRSHHAGSGGGGDNETHPGHDG